MSTVLKETYTTDLFMIKVTISQEGMYLEVIFHLFHYRNQHKSLKIKLQSPNINGDENSKFNTFDQLPNID